MEDSSFNLPEYIQVLTETQLELEREMTELDKKSQFVIWSRQYLKSTQSEMFDLYNNNKKLLEEKEKLIHENSMLLQKMTDEKRQREELEMKLTEMKKISEVMAKKASEEAVLKALRTYANTSKRKTVDKRAFAKTSILEIANANGLVLPQEFAASIESLDDERPEPKVMNVSGNYNDIHDNATVNQK